MAVKQFKAESKRLLDLMINSIYTHKEIFLRELISNANDALDKLYYRSLTDGSVGMSRGDFKIEIVADPISRTLKISDNGCGMSAEELEKHLGTIAESGSLAFKEKLKEEKKADGVDIIGQFGVGFYSAFMVAEEVSVVSRAFGASEAHRWFSSGAEGYNIEKAERSAAGTDVILKLKPDDADEKYGEYLETWRIRELIKKYSDYIRYPIVMEVEKSRPKKENEKEYETYRETETLNSMVPLWKRKKKDLKPEDYNNFYKEKFLDYEAPAKVIHTSVEGMIAYDALLFIPGKTPYNYYTKEYEKGLQLYGSGVLIMDRCADLLPDYFGFVKGLVDSQDLSLNISREMLQHDRQLKAIEQSLEKKIKSELSAMLEKEREAYEKFFKNFGLQLKAGVYDAFGAHKDLLKDLLLFTTSNEKKYATLAEYVSRMKEGQTEIYYAAGDSAERIEKAPQTERVKDMGYEILYLTEDIDEFVLRVLEEYGGKKFKSVSAMDLDVQTEEEKRETQKAAEDSKEMFAFMKDALGGKVKEVRLSKRLKSHAVCVTAAGELSLEMEKVLAAMPAGQKLKADRVLELNAAHPVFEALKRLYASDKDRLKEYTEMLYTQAILIEGLPVEDPAAFSDMVCRLMAKA